MSTETPATTPRKRGRPKSEAKAAQERRDRINTLTRALPSSLRTKARNLCHAEMTPLEILDTALAVLLTAKAEYLTEHAERIQAGAAQRDWADRLRQEAIRLRDQSGRLDDPDALRLLATAKAVDVPLPDSKSHHRILREYTDAERQLADSLAPYRGIGGYTRVYLTLDGVDPATLGQSGASYVRQSTPLDDQLIRQAEGALDE